MGDNRDLVHEFGLPEATKCPKCHKFVDNGFDDYDVDCGKPLESTGVWNLRIYCYYCKESFNQTWTLKPSLTKER